MRFKIVYSIVLFFSGCTYDHFSLPVLSDKFSDIQKQTFDISCNGGGCHDAATQKALLCLSPDSSYNQLMTHIIQQNGMAFRSLVIPFNPDSSFLVFKITKADGDVDYGALMPN